MLTVMLAGLAVFFMAGQLTAGKYLTLVFEAEEANNPTGKVWSVKKHGEDAGGKTSGKVLAVPYYKPGEHPPREEVTYTVNIPQNGIYYLWARSFWRNGCGNSFYIKIKDDKGDPYLGGDATYNCLHWVCLMESGTSKPTQLKLKKGEVTFVVASRESATEIDQFLLTTDPELYPANVYKPTPNLLVKVEKKNDK